MKRIHTDELWEQIKVDQKRINMTRVKREGGSGRGGDRAQKKNSSNRRFARNIAPVSGPNLWHACYFLTFILVPSSRSRDFKDLFFLVFCCS